MELASRRMQREYKTMQRMVEIYCGDRHPADASGAACAECCEFLDYAHKRLEKCPYGPAKPVCAKCPIHCYKKAQREQARAIMRHAGPRMALKHPWLTLTHLLDKLRRAEHPMNLRSGKRRYSNRPRA
jgi:hypothetical protein